MNSEKNNQPVRIRNHVYQFILWLLPVIILLLIEFFLRLFGYGYNFNLFINHPDKRFKDFKICNPSIVNKYFKKFETNIPPDDMFLKEKPVNGYRIFVLGSSTVVGFPYDQNILFSRILQERLQDSYPDKNIEVINTALTAINSYTFLDYIDDILKEKPDAILFYEGHNEFYGALGVGSNEAISNNRHLIMLHLYLLDFRIYQLIRNIISKTHIIPSGTKSLDKKGTLMTLIAGNSEITYKSKVYDSGIMQFKNNMNAIFEKAKKKHVPVYISEVVSNIRDLQPFCSLASACPLALDAFNRAKEFEKTAILKMLKNIIIRQRTWII